jgi:DNA-binding response OmpR family regulator
VSIAESESRHANAGTNALTLLPAGSFRLDDLSIDLGRALVQRGDSEIPLPKLSFDLLLALARSAPNLLTIDELMDQVWPGLARSGRNSGYRQSAGQTTARSVV